MLDRVFDPTIIAGATGDSLGIIIVFFVAFPILVNGLIAFAVAQALGERRENQAYRGRREERQV